MKCFSFLSVLILFCSCSRFQNPHYRHVKKVPAFTQSIPVIAENPQIVSDNLEYETQGSVATGNAAQQNVIIGLSDSICNVTNNTAGVEISRRPVSVAAPLNFDKKDTSVSSPVFNARRDWSVLVALVFIFCGFLLLIWSVAIIVALPAAFWIRLLIGIGMIPLSVKLILRGAGILLSRIRQPSNYKESGK